MNNPMNINEFNVMNISMIQLEDSNATLIDEDDVITRNNNNRNNAMPIIHDVTMANNSISVNNALALIELIIT
jgi:hypothetical protein